MRGSLDLRNSFIEKPINPMGKFTYMPVPVAPKDYVLTKAMSSGDDAFFSIGAEPESPPTITTANGKVIRPLKINLKNRFKRKANTN